jgi:release factor glutamine methyltransferase
VSAAPLRSVTVREALDSATIPLAGAGVDTPRLDAELLLAAVLGVERAALHAHPERALAPGEGRAFGELVRRRREREPVAYILGRKGFRHLELAVDARVLIPRPETELLVEVAVELVPKGARVVDVGTGSGAVALALAHERPDLRVTGSDVSPGALAVAGANAERLGLEVAFLTADLVPDGEWDAVLSNPPYVRDDERLAPEIERYEPPGALRAGPEGLDVLRRVAAARAPLLALEVGAGQAAAVAGAMRAEGFARSEPRRDLAGIERVVVGWR